MMSTSSDITIVPKSSAIMAEALESPEQCSLPTNSFAVPPPESVKSGNAFSRMWKKHTKKNPEILEITLEDIVNSPHVKLADEEDFATALDDTESIASAHSSTGAVARLRNRLTETKNLLSEKLKVARMESAITLKNLGKNRPHELVGQALTRAEILVPTEAPQTVHHEITTVREQEDAVARLNMEVQGTSAEQAANPPPSRLEYIKNKLADPNNDEWKEVRARLKMRKALTKIGEVNPLIEEHYEEDLLFAQRRVTAISNKIARIQRDKLEYEKGIRDANTAYENKVTDTLDTVCSFFSKLKPATLMTFLRCFIHGTTLMKVTAVTALFEQMGILYRTDYLLTVSNHVANFFLFINSVFNKSVTDLIHQQSSAKECLEQLFDCHFPPIPETAFTMLSAAVGFSAILTGGAISFATGKASGIAGYMKTFGDQSRTFNNLSQTLGHFKNLTTWITTHLGFEFKQSSEIEAKLIEMSTFADDLAERVEEARANPYKMYDGTIPAKTLSDDATAFEKWFLDLNKDGKLRSHASIYQRIVTSRTSLLTITKTIDRSLGLKQVPSVIWLWGTPGVGKTTAIDLIRKELEKLEHQQLPMYTRNVGEEFWSTYKQQPIIVYDDFSLDLAEKQDSQELMRINSSAAYGIPMAMLDDKGLFFNSRYVIIASNYDAPFTPGMNLDALVRRRDRSMLVWNTAVKEHLDNGGTLPTFDDWDNFVPGICFQEYHYETDANGSVNEASRIRMTGDVTQGKRGIKSLARQMHDKQKEKRAEFIAKLSAHTEHAHLLAEQRDDRRGPGVNVGDIPPYHSDDEDDDDSDDENPRPPRPPHADLFDGVDPQDVPSDDEALAEFLNRPDPNTIRGQRTAPPRRQNHRHPTPGRQNDQFHWRRPQQENEHEQPCIYWFWGDPGTGKTVLAETIASQTTSKAIEIWNDEFDDESKYAALTTSIKDMADQGRPLIISLNQDQHHAYFRWLDKDNDGSRLERTCRRVKFFQFTRNFSGMFFNRKKMTCEEVLEGVFENNVTIKAWDQMSKSCLHEAEPLARTYLVDSFREMVGSKFTSYFQKSAIHSIKPPDVIEFDLSKVSLVNKPGAAEIYSALTIRQIRDFSYLMPVCATIASSLRNVGYNDIGLEGLVRQTNQVRVKADLPHPLRVSFREGTFLIVSIAGILTAAIETEQRLLKRAGKYYFSTNGVERELTTEEADFHRMILGDLDFADEYAPPPPITRDQISFGNKFRAVIEKCLGYVTVLFTSALLIANLIEIRTSQVAVWHPNPEGRTLQDRVQEQQDNYDPDFSVFDDPGYASFGDWGDIDYDDDHSFLYKPNPGKKLSRSKFRCHCKSDYDCDLCSGKLPMFVDAEGGRLHTIVPSNVRAYNKAVNEAKLESASGRTPQSNAALESLPQLAKTTKARVKIESLTKLAETPTRRIKVENFDDVVKNAREKHDGPSIYQQLLKEESYHATHDERDWCPCHVNPGKRPPGGKQLNHHFCKQCDNYVLKLWNPTDFVNRCCYGCKGYDMPATYYHTPCKGCEGTIKNQGCEDQQFLDVARLVRMNVIEFNGFYGLMLHNNIGVAPKHCFLFNAMETKRGWRAETIKVIPRKDLVFFRLISNGTTLSSFKDIRKFFPVKGDPIPLKSSAVLIKDATNVAWYAPVEIVAQTTITPVGQIDERDAIQVRTCSSATFKSFMTKEGDCGSPIVAVNQGTTKKCLGIHVAGSDFYGYESHITQDLIPQTEVINQQSGLFDDMIQRNISLYYGDCAHEWCPIISNDGALIPTLKHRCGQCGEYVLELSNQLRDHKASCYKCEGVECPVFYTHKKKNCLKCKDQKKIDTEYRASPTHQIAPLTGTLGTFTVIGRTINSKGTPVSKVLPGKTKLRKSPFRTDMYGKPFEPAIMSKSDSRSQGQDPYLKNVDKWDRDRPPQDLPALTELAREMGDWYAHEIKKAGKNVHLLTIEEAINRDTSFQKSNPIYMHSSAGYPYASYPRTKHKAPMLVWRDKLGRYQIDRTVYEGQILGQHIHYLLENCKKGFKTACLFDVNLKDEALPQRKIDEVKTRSIVGSPLDFTIVHRMYLHTSMVSIMELVPITPIKVGIAPNTIEWNDLYKWLTQYNQYGFDGDYKHWDASVTAEEIEATAEFHNTIYRKCDDNWKPEDDTVRTTLYQILAHPLLSRDGLCVQSTGGVVSGQPGTGLDNSSINVMKIWRAWIMYVRYKKMPKYMASFQGFLDSVAVGVNGDDNCILPKPEYMDFNFKFVQEFMETVGATYTPARKTEVGKDEMAHITEMTFLKRHFQFFPQTDPYCVGGLTDDAFCKMTSNCKVTKAKPYDLCSDQVEFDPNTISQTVETYLVEASLRGPQFYARAKDHALEVCYHYGIDVPNPKAWINAFTEVYHHFKVRYIEVFM